MPALTRLTGLGVAALSLLASTVSASGHHGVGHAKRQGGGAVPRLEIRQLEADPDQFNLFMLAMQAYSQTNHNDPNSWYQIAGIHGMPYVPWNGVTGPNNGNGYCPHSSPLFICWHRSYVNLWEQQVLAQAQNVVNQFSGADRQRYQNALGTLRFPYWDWAEIPPSGNPGDTMPSSLTSATITVNSPTGQRQIPNPLYAFPNMNPHAQSDFSGIGGGDWNEWGSTLRYPTSQDVSAQSNDAAAVSAIGGYNGQARSQVYRVLTACNDFLEISNDGVAESDASCGINLESIHNGIHTFTGGNVQAGHMTYNNFAAFDPIFWLHHANVDRLFALWQALHPGSYIGSTNQGPTQTYTINANQPIDGNTQLAPFGGDTCNSIRDVTAFGYTYPELQSGNVAQAVNNLYGPGARPQSISSRSSSSSSTSSASSSTSSASSSGSRSGSSSSSSSVTGPSTNTATPTTITTTDSNGSTITTTSTPTNTGGPTGQPTTITTTDSQGSTITTTSTPTNTGGPTGQPTTITTTDSQGSTITTVSTPGAPGGGPTGQPTTITTTDSQGSTITTVSTPGAPGGGPTGQPTTITTTDSQGSTITTVSTPGAPGGGSTVSTITTTGSNGQPTTQTTTYYPPGPTGTGPGQTSPPGGLNSTSPPYGNTHDYTCHVVSEKHGLGGTYAVYAFLGPNAGSSPADYMSSPDFAGAHAVFAPYGATGNQMLVSGQISLTNALAGKVASGHLPSLEENDVLPFLAQNLNWKVATAAGQDVDNSAVPGLTVGAVSQKIMPAANPGTLPTYGSGNLVQSVTNGKAGGIQEGMQYDWWNVCGTEGHKEL